MLKKLDVFILLFYLKNLYESCKNHEFCMLHGMLSLHGIM